MKADNPQTRITGAQTKRLAQRLAGYGSIGIAIGIDFFDPIAGRTSFIARRYTSGLSCQGLWFFDFDPDPDSDWE